MTSQQLIEVAGSSVNGFAWMVVTVALFGCLDIELTFGEASDCESDNDDQRSEADDEDDDDEADGSSVFSDSTLEWCGES